MRCGFLRNGELEKLSHPGRPTEETGQARCPPGPEVVTLLLSRPTAIPTSFHIAPRLVSFDPVSSHLPTPYQYQP